MLKAKLVVVGGDAKSTEVNLKLPCIIGRAKDATLTLPHPLVSRQHCEIYEKNSRLFVKDLGSLNGTFVNNQRIEGEIVLNPNELLTLGNVTFRAIYDLPTETKPVTAESAPPKKKTVERKPVAKKLAQHKHQPVKPSMPASTSAETPVVFESVDDKETVYSDDGDRSASDTDKSLIGVAVAENSNVISGIDQLPVGPDKSVSLSSLEGLPSPDAAASFVGGIDLPGAQGESREVQPIQIDLSGETEKPKLADDSGLGSFLKKLPK